MKEQKKKLVYMIADLPKEKEGTKERLRKIKEMCVEE